MIQLKPLLKTLFILALITGFNSCKENTKNQTATLDNPKPIKVFNYHNKQELTEYDSLNLDETHPNLLNPQISASDYHVVMNSWTDLHQRIGNYLSDNDFNWDVQDSTITIVHKIYFNPNGDITNYFFNVLDTTVTKEKQEQFADLISDFAERNTIALKKDKTFAQCGKTRYLNN
jgi:hypothetical protein